MEQTKRVETVYHVINRIRDLPAMSCLDAREYAVENGWAHVVARDIQKDMKFTQLRKFFDSVKQIKMKLKRYNKDDRLDEIGGVDQERYELFPELAYARGRELVTKEFYELMKLCLAERMTSVGDFLAFEKFLSDILAYCKMCELTDKRKREGGE